MGIFKCRFPSAALICLMEFCWLFFSVDFYLDLPSEWMDCVLFLFWLQTEGVWHLRSNCPLYPKYFSSGCLSVDLFLPFLFINNCLDKYNLYIHIHSIVKSSSTHLTLYNMIFNLQITFWLFTQMKFNPKEIYMKFPIYFLIHTFFIAGFC